MTGVVIFYDARERYGFIEIPGVKDIFFDAGPLKGIYKPTVGDEVSFDTEVGHLDERAIKVALLKKAISGVDWGPDWPTCYRVSKG